jgi:mono/diheme cytochrome c family protein
MKLRTTVIVTAAVFLVGGSVPSRGAEDAASVFKEQCAKCHGETGHSDTSAGKMMKVPELAGNAKVAGMSLADIVKAVRENEKHKATLKKLSDAQIEAGATRAKAIAEGK